MLPRPTHATTHRTPHNHDEVCPPHAQRSRVRLAAARPLLPKMPKTSNTQPLAVVSKWRWESTTDADTDISQVERSRPDRAPLCRPSRLQPRVLISPAGRSECESSEYTAAVNNRGRESRCAAHFCCVCAAPGSTAVVLAGSRAVAVLTARLAARPSSASTDREWLRATRVPGADQSSHPLRD